MKVSLNFEQWLAVLAALRVNEVANMDQREMDAEIANQIQEQIDPKLNDF